MKDILIVAHYTQAPSEKGNGRFYYIAENINKNNATIEVVTSNFSHRSKSHKNLSNIQKNNIGYKLTMISEPGYTKNVSFKRLYSHYIMSRNLKRYLKDRKKPDIIYCSIPPLNTALVTAKYAVKNNIRFVLDVQDLWPEAFKMVFNVPIISDILFFPLKRQADYVYAVADEIVGVSQTYVDRALKNNKKCKSGHCVYLGTDLNTFDYYIKNSKIKEKSKDEIWLAYVGTLGHSYDLISVIDAIKLLKDKGIENIKFIVMGDGPFKSKFEKYAKEKEIYAEFTGRLSYEEMVGILAICDIAVNPIRKGSAGSIINKVGDYAAAGLPVINTQECSEYKELLTKYNAGFNCINGDIQDLAKKIFILYKDSKLRKEMGKNNRILAEEKFDRRKTYLKIFDLITNN